MKYLFNHTPNYYTADDYSGTLNSVYYSVFLVVNTMCVISILG